MTSAGGQVGEVWGKATGLVLLAGKKGGQGWERAVYFGEGETVATGRGRTKT